MEQKQEPTYQGRTLDAWIVRLKGNDYTKCGDAARVLGEMGSAAKGAVPALLELALNDSVPYTETRTRVAAAYALLRIGADDPCEKKVLKFLTDLVNHKSLYGLATRALGKLGAEAEAAVPTLVEVLKKNPNIDIRLAVAEALGQIGAEAAVPALVEALKGPDLELRRAVPKVLGQIGADTAVPALTETLKNDEDYMVRIYSARRWARSGRRRKRLCPL